MEGYQAQDHLPDVIERKVCPVCGGEPPCVAHYQPGVKMRVVEYVRADAYQGAVDRIAALEAALTEAVGIVSGGRNPESARNRRAEAWRSLLGGGEE